MVSLPTSQLSCLLLLSCLTYCWGVYFTNVSKQDIPILGRRTWWRAQRDALRAHPGMLANHNPLNAEEYFKRQYRSYKSSQSNEELSSDRVTSWEGKHTYCISVN